MGVLGDRGNDEIPPRQPGCCQPHLHRRGLMGVSFLESRRLRVDLDSKTPVKLPVVVIEEVEP